MMFVLGDKFAFWASQLFFWLYVPGHMVPEFIFILRSIFALFAFERFWPGALVRMIWVRFVVVEIFVVTDRLQILMGFLHVPFQATFRSASIIANIAFVIRMCIHVGIEMEFRRRLESAMRTCVNGLLFRSWKLGRGHCGDRRHRAFSRPGQHRTTRCWTHVMPTPDIWTTWGEGCTSGCDAN
jgi:hypothetical protein